MALPDLRLAGRQQRLDLARGAGFHKNFEAVLGDDRREAETIETAHLLPFPEPEDGSTGYSDGMGGADRRDFSGTERLQVVTVLRFRKARNVDALPGILAPHGKLAKAHGFVERTAVC